MPPFIYQQSSERVSPAFAARGSQHSSRQGIASSSARRPVNQIPVADGATRIFSTSVGEQSEKHHATLSAGHLVVSTNKIS